MDRPLRDCRWPHLRSNTGKPRNRNDRFFSMINSSSRVNLRQYDQGFWSRLETIAVGGAAPFASRRRDLFRLFNGARLIADFLRDG